MSNTTVKHTPAEDQVHPNDRREQSVNLWERAFLATQKSERNFKKRLNELETWDDCNGNNYEQEVKIEALKRLLGK
jgi:hypothetical protein